MSAFFKEYEDGMKPKYKYRPGVLGAPLSIQSANQIQDMGMRLNEGMKNIEISAISPEIAEGIPEEHFDEMRRLGKLTESKVSLHAPITDASGFTQQGWSEQNRRAAEQEFTEIVKRSHKLDDEGNVPVVIHGANFMGAEWDKSLDDQHRKDLVQEHEDIIQSYRKAGERVPKEAIEKLEQEKKRLETARIPRMLTVVNQATGQVQGVEFEKRYRIEEEEPIIWTPERRIKSINKSNWDQEKLKVLSMMKESMELEDRNKFLQKQLEPYYKGASSNVLKEHEKMEMSQLMQQKNMIDQHINTIGEHVESAVGDIYTNYKKFSSKEALEKNLKNIEHARNNLKMLSVAESGEIKNIIENKSLNEEQKKGRFGEIRNKYENQKAKMITDSLSIMQEAPELFKPVNEFAIDKASETFANVAFNSFKKFKEESPIIVIENSYPNMPLSTAEDLKEAIQKSRKKFVDRLVKEEKVERGEAEKISKKIIGATWDVGHINMLRKAGYSEEEILEEAKRIAPYVKHVHLTDNFGFNDTHLPPGMGNVPIKKTLEILEKEGNLEGVRQIIEAGNFVQNFKQSPYPYALEALESPIYAVGGVPYWSEVQEKTSREFYGTGFGEMLPEYHFKQFYGAGWANVPRELGGSKEGPDKGRFAGGGE